MELQSIEIHFLKNPRVIFRTVSDGEYYATLKSFVDTATSFKVDADQVQDEYVCELALQEQSIGAIADESAKKNKLAELKSKDGLRRVKEIARNRIVSRLKKDVGEKEHAETIVLWKSQGQFVFDKLMKDGRLCQ